MTKRILAITFLIMASFFVACGSDEQPAPQVGNMSNAPKSVAIVQVEPFTAPESSVINAEKAKLYAKASAGLLELGVTWSDRIDKAPEVEKLQILNAYNVARDQLCARIGLAGIAEYNWITTVALPDVKNKAVFEGVGVKVGN
ncbi:MAG: hypothetical protein HUK19_07165 [Fibrobacter sp.]|nr:hypothetical protein [Fibrobacter sp.]